MTYPSSRTSLPLRPIVLLIAAILASTCSKKPPSAPVPVILISIDTLRADHLPSYGYRGITTPNLDALRRDSILYLNAWSHCPMTLPSHLSMLTGLLPQDHGVRNNLGFSFDGAKFPTLATVLKAHGYSTGAAVSAYVLRGSTGIKAGFDQYDDAIDLSGGDTLADFQRPGGQTVDAAERWLSGIKGKPFFLFLHLFEPHSPYAPPEPFKSRYANPYDGEIATADAIVGKFLSNLKASGLYDRSLIILTSDHGEGLGDHGESQHSVLLYTEAIHVPLMIKRPGSPGAGSSAAWPVQLIDIAPTVAQVTGAAFPAPLPGRSLLDPPPQPERFVYSETMYPPIHLGWSALSSLIASRYHYIDGPKPELYDIVRDPSEKVDQSASQRRIAAQFRDDLQGLEKPLQSAGTINPEDARRLEALGYVGSGGISPPSMALPNPRDHIAELEELRTEIGNTNLARGALARGDVRGADAFISPLLASPRVTPTSLIVAAQIAERRGDFRRALSETDRAAAIARARASRAVFQLDFTRAEILVRLGRYPEAVEAYRREIAAFSDELPAYANLAALYFAMGNPSQGRAIIGEMAGKNPGRETYFMAARTLAAVEDMTDAEEWKRKALAAAR